MKRFFAVLLSMFLSLGVLAETHTYTFPKFKGERRITFGFTYSASDTSTYTLMQKRNLLVKKSLEVLGTAGTVADGFTYERKTEDDSLMEDASIHIKVCSGCQLAIPAEILSTADYYAFDEIESGRFPEKGGFSVVWMKGYPPAARNLKLEVK